MRPGPKLTASLWALVGASLIVPLLPEAIWLLAAGLVAVLGIAAAEYVALRRVIFSAERAKTIALSLDEEESVALQLTTNAPAALRLEVRQLWPVLIESRSSTSAGICRPGEVLRLEFKIRSVGRGTASIPAPTVAASMWGWTERILSVGGETELSVLPNLKAVKRLHKELNQYVLRGLGSRVSPRLGKGRDFDRLRDYVMDDDFRDIAWKASARHDRLIVREYRLDRSQDVLLCLDRGHRMAARTTRISRMDHAVNASVLISYICNRMEDRIGMMAFGAQAEQGIAQGKGAEHLRQLTAYATGLSGEYIHTDYMALAAHLRGRMRHRSLILIITTLPEQDEKQSLVRAVRMLTPQHLPVCIVLSDPALKAAAQFLPADRAELCRTLVARDAWSAKHQMMQELRRLGAWVVETTPEDAGVDSVNAYLDVKRRQLL